jgi:hypothetical protein
MALRIGWRIQREAVYYRRVVFQRHFDAFFGRLKNALASWKVFIWKSAFEEQHLLGKVYVRSD